MSDVQTFEELANRLEIAGGFAIIDRTLYDGVHPPYRTIELRENSWNGPVLGGFGEYSTDSKPIRFTPVGTVSYGTMAPIVAALEELGVVVEVPA